MRASDGGKCVCRTGFPARRALSPFHASLVEVEILPGGAWEQELFRHYSALDDGFNIVLVNGLSDFEYLYPFYFGRSGENVFVMMFERPRDGSELRFAQSPSGGGTGNPAWDFVYFQRGYEVSREFCFRARAVFRKFKDTEEVIHLYEQWSGEKVVRPNSRSKAESPTK